MHLCALVMLCLMFGCSFFQGKHYASVKLETKPSNVAVYKIYTRHLASNKAINEGTQYLGNTPLALEIPKNSQVMVVFAKEGYKNKEFIIRTNFKKIYTSDGKHHSDCLDENIYDWIDGSVIKNVTDFLTPNVRKQYCSASQYEYEIKMESLQEDVAK